MSSEVTFDSNGSIAKLKSLAKQLTQSDIYSAVEKFTSLNGEINTYSHSTTYDLIVDGTPYPPKAIFGLAMSELIGMEVKSSHFSAGLRSANFLTLERLGFEIRLKSGNQNESSSKSDRLWTEEELSETVDAYLEMLHKGEIGIPYKKSVYFKQLADKFNRTPKAFGRRMSNITHIMMLMDLPSLAGFSPLSNVGKHNRQLLKSSFLQNYANHFLGLGLLMQKRSQ